MGRLDEARKAAGAAELREIGGDRPDLLAEVAGISLGAAEGKRPEDAAEAQAIAELCRLAGTGVDQIPQRAEEGRRRAEAAQRKPGTWRASRVNRSGLLE